MNELLNTIKEIRSVLFQLSTINNQLDTLEERLNRLDQIEPKEFSKEDEWSIDLYRYETESMESFFTRLGFENFLREQQEAEQKQRDEITEEVNKWIAERQRKKWQGRGK